MFICEEQSPKNRKHFLCSKYNKNWPYYTQQVILVLQKICTKMFFFLYWEDGTLYRGKIMNNVDYLRISPRGWKRGHSNNTWHFMTEYRPPPPGIIWWHCSVPPVWCDILTEIWIYLPKEAETFRENVTWHLQIPFLPLVVLSDTVPYLPITHPCIIWMAPNTNIKNYTIIKHHMNAQPTSKAFSLLIKSIVFLLRKYIYRTAIWPLLKLLECVS